MSANSLNLLGSVRGMGQLTKARFGAGMLLEHEDLDALARYTQELSRLLFRSLLGCGVICGLEVKVGQKCGKVQVSVGDGVALDCCGDPIHVRGAKSIALEGCEPELPGEMWVLLCARYQCCAPRASMCDGDAPQESPQVCTRERYGWEIRIVARLPECACGCQPVVQDVDGEDQPVEPKDDDCQCVDPDHPCYRDHYLGKCGCECAEGATCECDCIVLAKLVNDGDNDDPEWRPEHKWRRFIRPMLIEDPVMLAEYRAAKEAANANNANVAFDAAGAAVNPGSD